MLSRLYAYRSYIWRNAWTAFRHRYAGTGAGIFWNIINPLVEVLVYTVVFSRLISLRSNGTRDITYILYLCTGLFPWLSFAEALTRGTNSILSSKTYLRHLPIPSEVFVAINSVSTTINLVIYLLLLIGLNFILGGGINWNFLFLPVLGLLLQLLSLGMTLGLASLQVLIQDVGQVLGAVMQVWRWTLPIMYDETIFPAKYLPYYHLNPPYYFIKSIRDIILYQQSPTMEAWGYMIFWTVLFWVAGSLIARKTRADVRDAL
jgi:lipopolysaccharide transport system permease protein